ncbi:MAG: peptidase domain-containing ABC transporter, partial [Gammaproteobacteria bacterium]|nr:peptidase domain-containing ABC transporter [Gammaproteobacteria bacterium]
SRFGSLRAVQELISTQAVAALIDGLMATTTLTVMFLYNDVLALVVAGSLIAYALLRVLFLPRLRLKSIEVLLAEAKKESYFLESIRGILSIKSFARERQRESGLGAQHAKALNASAQTRKIEIWLIAGNQLLFGLQNVAVIWIGALAILDGTFTVGMLLAFLAYKNQFTQRASTLVDRITEFRLATIHLDRLADVVYTEAEDLPDQLKTGGTTPLKGDIELRDIWFRYADTDPFVLRRVNLHIKAGEHVAITAPSGYGKTTLIKIILGLLSPTRGEVLVDGKPLQHHAIKNYRSQVSAVMQEDQLLAGSLLDNITFFDSEADPQLAVACAQMAAINDEIVLMPMQYHSLVGDMGAALSGGQKQRVLLARALYQQPRVLILDEASSHLDAALEARTVAAIRTLSITRIVVAHRRETLEQVDRLIRLDGDGA